MSGSQYTYSEKVLEAAKRFAVHPGEIEICEHCHNLAPVKDPEPESQLPEMAQKAAIITRTDHVLFVSNHERMCSHFNHCTDQWIEHDIRNTQVPEDNSYLSPNTMYGWGVLRQRSRRVHTRVVTTLLEGEAVFAFILGRHDNVRMPTKHVFLDRIPPNMCSNAMLDFRESVQRLRQCEECQTHRSNRSVSLAEVRTAMRDAIRGFKRF